MKFNLNRYPGLQNPKIHCVLCHTPRLKLNLLVYLLKVSIAKLFLYFKALSAVELQNIMRQNAALQLASDYGMQAIQLSQPTVQLPQPTIIPQQFSMQVNLYEIKL